MAGVKISLTQPQVAIEAWVELGNMKTEEVLNDKINNNAQMILMLFK
jgi:hypothetical protein